MKQFFAILFVFFLCSAQAATYYFSSVSGDDSRTSAQAQSASTPWKSLSKLNSFFSSLQPGDFVLFKRGERFYGSITANKSGTSGSPIVFGAYGDGGIPVIHGWSVPGGWTQTRTNVWTSAPISGTPVNGLNIVTINGKIYAKGKSPDAGYYTGSTYVTGKSATNTAFSGHNYTGAEIATRSNHWKIDVQIIGSQSGSTVYYSGDRDGGAVKSSAYQNGWGAFIQNHPDCLNRNGEWYFNKSTRQLSVYWPSNPGSSVAVAIQQNLVTLGSVSYCTFKNINFEGAAGKAISYEGSGGTDVTFDGCLIEYAYEGVKVSWEKLNCKFLNTRVLYTLNSGLHNQSTNGLIDNCQSRVSGAWPGMGGTGDGQYFNVKIGADPDRKGTLQNSLIDSSGYVGVAFAGNNTLIRNNVIKNHCFIKDDGGGIYSYNSSRIVHSGRIIRNNLLLNAIGAQEGTPSQYKDAFHVYLDNMSDHVEMYENTFAYAGAMAFFYNSANNCYAHNNYSWSNNYGGVKYQLYASDQVPYANKIHSNVFVSAAGNSRQGGVSYYNGSPAASWGTLDSNRYASSNGYVGMVGSTSYTLPNWRSSFGYDKNGTVRNGGTGVLFIYNEEKSQKTFNLNGKTYEDIYGVKYTTAILNYCESKILFEVPVSARPLITSNTENKLEVNTPNPARGSTTIRYHIASDNAFISLTNMTGILLKTIILNRGSKQVALDTWNLAPGIYNYTLYVEGKLVNSKRMVVAR